MSNPTQQPGQARRAQVPHACTACRGSKVKCSGERPTCTRCRNRKILCSYEVEQEGVTKRESLSRELSENRQRLEDATAILDMMRYGSDMLATETLARLRLGMGLEQIRQVRHGERLDQGFQSDQTPSLYLQSARQELHAAQMAAGDDEETDTSGGYSSQHLRESLSFSSSGPL